MFFRMKCDRPRGRYQNVMTRSLLEKAELMTLDLQMSQGGHLLERVTGEG